MHPIAFRADSLRTHCKRGFTLDIAGRGDTLLQFGLQCAPVRLCSSLLSNFTSSRTSEKGGVKAVEDWRAKTPGGAVASPTRDVGDARHTYAVPWPTGSHSTPTRHEAQPEIMARRSRRARRGMNAYNEHTRGRRPCMSFAECDPFQVLVLHEESSKRLATPRNKKTGNTCKLWC